MKSSLAAAALIALGSLSTAADTLAEKPDCAADLAYAVTLLNGQQFWPRVELRPGAVPVEEDGRCVLRGGVFSFKSDSMPYLQLMEEVSWTAVWGEDGRESIPLKVMLDVPKGQRRPDLGGFGIKGFKPRQDPKKGFWSLSVDFEFDQDRLVLLMNRYDFTSSNGAHILSSWRLQFVEPADEQLNAEDVAPRDLLGIKEFELRLQDEGYLQQWIDENTAILKLAFQSSSDAMLDWLKGELTAEVKELPDNVIDEDSLSALLSMISMIPAPEGVMHLKIGFKKGFFFSDALNESRAINAYTDDAKVEPLASILQRFGATISARHEPVLP